MDTGRSTRCDAGADNLVAGVARFPGWIARLRGGEVSGSRRGRGGASGDSAWRPRNPATGYPSSTPSAANRSEVDETLQSRRGDGHMPTFFRQRLPKRRTVFKVLSISFVVVVVAFLLLALWVYRQSVGKFEIRRLSLPTASTPTTRRCTPATPLAPDDLIEKLDRLGYRPASSLTQAGDYVHSKSQIDMYAAVQSSQRPVSLPSPSESPSTARTSRRVLSLPGPVRLTTERWSPNCWPRSPAINWRTGGRSRSIRCRRCCRTRSSSPRTCVSGITPASIRSDCLAPCSAT